MPGCGEELEEPLEVPLASGTAPGAGIFDEQLKGVTKKALQVI